MCQWYDLEQMASLGLSLVIYKKIVLQIKLIDVCKELRRVPSIEGLYMFIVINYN